MTMHDLLELAVLDAHGMLDDDERRGFERSLNAASEPVRRQIQREQARLVDLTGLLPEVSPPESLRERVLSAVRAEIREQLETVRVQDSRMPQTSGMAASPRTVRHEPTANSTASNDAVPTPRRLRRPSRVNALWRAGTLGLTAAAVTLAVMMVNLRNEYVSLADRIDTDARLDAAIQSLGSENLIDTIFDSQTVRVTFQLAPEVMEGLNGAAPMTSIYFNPDWSGCNIYHRLPAVQAGESYELAILDDNDDIASVAYTFSSSGSLTISRIEDKSITASTRLAIFHISATGDARRLLVSVPA